MAATIKDAAELHELICSLLLTRLKDPEHTTFDIWTAMQFLKDNGVTDFEGRKGSDLKPLKFRLDYQAEIQDNQLEEG